MGNSTPTRTHTRGNPYPRSRVWVQPGMGMGTHGLRGCQTRTGQTAGLVGYVGIQTRTGQTAGLVNFN